MNRKGRKTKKWNKILSGTKGRDTNSHNKPWQGTTKEWTEDSLGPAGGLLLSTSILLPTQYAHKLVTGKGQSSKVLTSLTSTIRNWGGKVGKGKARRKCWKYF